MQQVHLLKRWLSMQSFPLSLRTGAYESCAVKCCTKQVVVKGTRPVLFEQVVITYLDAWLQYDSTLNVGNNMIIDHPRYTFPHTSQMSTYSRYLQQHMACFHITILTADAHYLKNTAHNERQNIRHVILISTANP